MSLCSATEALAACPSTVDYTVDASGAGTHTTVSAAVAQAVTDGLTSATICVEPDFSTVSALCPAGDYVDNVTVTGGLGIDLHFRDRTCLSAASSSSAAITFDAAGASSLNDFHKIIGTGAASAVFVQNTTLSITGRGPSGGEPMSEVTSPGGSAIEVGFQGTVDSVTTDYGESLIGVEVYGTPSTSGGDFASTGGLVRNNNTGYLIYEFGSVDSHRDITSNGQWVGYVLGNGSITMTDARIQNNDDPTCTTGWAPSFPAYAGAAGAVRPAGGLLIEGVATANILNTRWTGNCTHVDSDIALARSHDNSTLVVRNSTFDNNASTFAVRAAGGPATVWDNIVADDLNAFGAPKIETALQCSSSTPGLHDFDSNVVWQIDTPTVGPCGFTNTSLGDPDFVTFNNGIIGRDYHLTQATSAAVNHSGRTMGTTGSIYSSPPFTSSSYGTAPRDPDPAQTDPLLIWVPDTNAVDAGFHWFSP